MAFDFCCHGGRNAGRGESVLGYLYRSVDIDDVILYVIGGLLSYAWLGRYAKENNTSHKE